MSGADDLARGPDDEDGAPTYYGSVGDIPTCGWLIRLSIDDDWTPLDETIDETLDVDNEDICQARRKPPPTEVTITVPYRWALACAEGGVSRTDVIDDDKVQFICKEAIG